MIIYIYGEDTYRSREYLRHSIKQFKTTRDPAGYNVVILPVTGGSVRLDETRSRQASGGDDLGKILGELSATPFLAEKRMVVIENILASKDKELLAVMIEKIKKQVFGDSPVVVFWQGEPLSKIKEAKELEALLKKEKYAREFAPLAGASLNAWVKSEGAARGGSITPEAAAKIGASVSDTWEASNLIDILLAFCGAEPVTPEAVGLFVKAKLDDNIFSLVDAVAQGDHKKALQLLAHQRGLGEEDGRIVGLVIWQYRILLQIADFLEGDSAATSDAIARELGLHPFVVKKNLGLARRAPLAQLQKTYRKFLELEQQIKTSLAPRELLLDFFVAAI
ncbi:MAG: DNA polymerase III subunit delta [Candidatus Magasanikbacteria bacterium]|nr:DNA polymerase III subunit delta [Candidatus Magasanikbacteria bacterium]